MRCAGDDTDRTINWLLEQDPAAVQKRFGSADGDGAGAGATGAATGATAGSGSDGASLLASVMRSSPELTPVAELPPPAAMVRQASANKYTVLQIVAVHERERSVVLLPVLDRCRIPLDPDQAQRQTVSLSALLESGNFRLVTDAEQATLATDVATRVPEIVYQAFGHGEFSPISITPPIDFADYKIDYDSHAKILRRISHQRDGQILFTAVA